MKMVKNIAIVAFATSFMFASVSFNMSNIYAGMDAGTTVTSSWGAAYDLNESTSLGYDSSLGMLFMFDVPAGVTLRLAWDGDADDDLTDATVATTAIGLGFTWWTGGTGLKTSISTAYDMVSISGGDSEGKLSVSVGFGF